MTEHPKLLPTRPDVPHVEALESAGLVHIVIEPNSRSFGGQLPATNMTPDEARAFATDLIAAAAQVDIA
jgi:hypothetical protein